MTLFAILVALLLIVANAAVLLPLLKGGRSRWAAVMVAIAVPLGTTALYRHVSTWPWNSMATTTAPPSQPGNVQNVTARVALLQQRLRTQPENIEAWLLLGKSHLTLGNADAAANAFAQAQHAGGGRNAAAALGLGWAVSLHAGGRITGEADGLFERAIVLAPHDPQALYFSGLAAAQRGETDLARQRFLELKSLHPAPRVAAILDAQLSAMEQQVSITSHQASAAATQVTVNLALAPALAARISAATPLFIIARLPDQEGPPIAARRVTTTAIGTTVSLSSTDSMIPGRVLRPGMQVVVTARIAFNGLPAASKGDFYGQLVYRVGQDGPRELRIDKIL